jgi:hypothetical protein
MVEGEEKITNHPVPNIMKFSKNRSIGYRSGLPRKSRESISDSKRCKRWIGDGKSGR